MHELSSVIEISAAVIANTIFREDEILSTILAIIKLVIVMLSTTHWSCGLSIVEVLLNRHSELLVLFSR
jgi:hypothetical protein